MGRLCVQGKPEAAWRPEIDLCVDNGLLIARQLHRLLTGCSPVAHRLHAGRTGVAIRQQVGKWEAVESGARAEAGVATYHRDGWSQFDIPAHHESVIIRIENALENPRSHWACPLRWPVDVWDDQTVFLGIAFLSTVTRHGC